MGDDDLWKRRFYLFTASRLFGLALVLLGMVIASSGLLQPGGWPEVGLAVALAGLVESILVPKLLKKQWDRE